MVQSALLWAGRSPSPAQMASRSCSLHQISHSSHAQPWHPDHENDCAGLSVGVVAAEASPLPKISFVW